MSPPTTLTQIGVRVRSTYYKRGACERALVVHCPERGATCSLDRCHACQRSHGLRLDQNGIRAVLCASAPPSPAAATETLTLTIPTMGEVMGESCVCLAASVGCGDARTLLIERGLSGAPVVGPGGRPVGMLARSDLLGALALGSDARTVDEVMMPIPFMVDEHVSLLQGAALMATEGVHHVLVTAGHLEIVGLVTTLDVTRWLARQGGHAA